MQKNIDVIKAKVDYLKTLFAVFWSTAITSMIAYFAIADETGRSVFFWIAIGVGFAAVMTYKMYDRRHRDLIVELKK